MNEIELAGAIIGLINGFKLLQTNRQSFFYFLLALAAGVAAGYFGLFGATIETGILAALASSGLYKISQNIKG